MNCEVEFLPVGSESKGGDAIVVRYGYENDFGLMLIDGGFEATGTEIVEHLNQEFPGRRLDHVVLTHADHDHASGLREVLRQVEVGTLWMHVPWMHAAEAAHLFADKTLSVAQLKQAIRAEYNILSDIVDIAESKGVPIYCPFQGDALGPFVVASPSRAEYVRLLPQFDRTPEADSDALARYRNPLETVAYNTRRLLAGLIEKATSWVEDRWDVESLRDGGVTSPTNESSLVLYGVFGERRVLLTGDAGIGALTSAADYADAAGLPLRQFSFVQVPHHGSRSNVGPMVLNRLVGPIVPDGAEPTFSAIVSAPANDEMHPRKIVLNAFIRRGAQVVATQGSKAVYYGGFRPRRGYGNVEPIPFSSSVEAYD